MSYTHCSLHKNMSEVYIFLADGFEEVEGLTVVDLLRRADISVGTVSIYRRLKVLGAHDIAVDADYTLDEVSIDNADMLVLPGGMPGTIHLKENSQLMEILCSFYMQGKRVAAICAAPSILGELGMLDGKKAVCFPGFEEKLTGAQVTEDKVVTDGLITTSRALGTAIPFALELIRLLRDEETADKVKKTILYGHS